MKNIGQIPKFLKKAGGPVSKDIVIPNAPEGKLRVRIVVEPEGKK